MSFHDPKFNTSLYNHGAISDGVRPLIGNNEYSALLQRVKSGDHSAYDEAKKSYCFEPFQIKLIEHIINNSIV